MTNPTAPIWWPRYLADDLQHFTTIERMIRSAHGVEYCALVRVSTLLQNVIDVELKRTLSETKEIRNDVINDS